MMKPMVDFTLSTEEALGLCTQRRGHCNEDVVILPSRQRSPDLFRQLFYKGFAHILVCGFPLGISSRRGVGMNRVKNTLRFALITSVPCRDARWVDLACLLSWDTYCGWRSYRSDISLFLKKYF